MSAIRLYLVGLGIATVGLAAIDVAPRASFVASCATTSSYRLDASASIRGDGGPLVQYRWSLPSGAVRDSLPTRTASWSGKVVVKLQVVDSAGRVSGVVQRTLTTPCVPPVKPETVVVYRDTLYLVNVLPAWPPPDSGRVVLPLRPTEFLVYENQKVIGRVIPWDLVNDIWFAAQLIPGSSVMPCLGLAGACFKYNSQAAARDALPSLP